MVEGEQRKDQLSEREKKFQIQRDKAASDAMYAKARVYDLLYPDQKPHPTDAELKAKIISLERDIKKLVEIKDSISERSNQLRTRILELEAMVKELQGGKSGRK